MVLNTSVNIHIFWKYFRLDCPVPYSECVGLDHIASCECKEGFHGNGTENCVPDGFTEEENGNS